MGRTHALPVLERLAIASPCTMSWDSMTGDEKSRHCAQCNLKVHNLSAMTREEAEALISGPDNARVCVRLYRRSDGTVMTQDCPVGLAAARARLRRVVARMAAAFGMVSTAALAGMEASQPDSGAPIRLRALNPFARLAEWIVPTAPPMPPAFRPVGVLMGAVCLPPLPPAPPPDTLCDDEGNNK
jgi:hypothetical protein